MRYVAGQPAERILPPGSFASIGQALPPGEPLSTEERIRILVWNIYKQQRAEWLSVLKNYGKDAHLVLLQEAQTTPELVQFATANYLAADQVPAFVLPQHPSGVMTLSAAHPVYCCPLREREPILRLAKSALVTVYPLPDTRLLMVVNIHAVNFSLGVDVYSKQLLPIGDQIAHHSGPVIADSLEGDNKMFYSIYDNGAKAAMGNFAAFSAIPGVEVRTVFFDPVNSLVSGSMTEQQWIDGIKSASDQMRANIIE